MKHSEILVSKIKSYLRWFLWPEVWLWAFPIVLLVPNILLAFTEFNSLPAKLSNIFLPLGLYYLLISLSEKVGRTMLYFFPIIFFGAFQIVLLFLYGESIIAIDMYINVLTTSVTEATELLDNLKSAIFVVILMYIPAIVAAVTMVLKKIRANRKNLMTIRRLSYLLLFVGVFFFLISVFFVSNFNARRELFPYNVIENLGTAIKRTNESMHYHTTSSRFSYHPTATRDKDRKEVFVLVLGETSRADNWQLFGYNRPTNPKLSVRPNIITFDKAVTEINTTHKAVPMLLSYLTPENFGDSVAHTKSIFSAFNDLGYTTAFISNQRRNHSYIDFYGDEAQKCTFLTDGGNPQEDLNLVEAMRNILENSSNNKIFIVLHTYGSHFEYKNRYPDDMAFFTPDNKSDASFNNRKELINAYDNTIRYTDTVLDSVITILDELDADATMVYVSDHAEDIFDDERNRFLHSSPTPTYFQIHVPMMIWMSDEFKEEHPDLYASAKNNAHKNVATTTSMFHSIIQMAGIRSKHFDETYSIVSDKFTEEPRRYLNDYNEAVPLSESGLRDLDFKMFKAKGISYE